MWGVAWLTPGVLFEAIYSAVLVVATAVVTWFARGWKERSRSLKVEWADLIQSTRDVGQYFLIEATVYNRTDQTRPFEVHLAGGVPGFDDVFDKYSVEAKYAVQMDGRFAVPPRDHVLLRIELPTIKYGTSEVEFTILGTKGRHHQRYPGRRYLLRVEKPQGSDWSRMSPQQRADFATDVLAKVYERWSRSPLTKDRIIEFYDDVEAGRMAIMGGAIFQAFPGHYTRAERRYLLIRARASGISIRWAERSEPLGFWKGLLFRNA